MSQSAPSTEERSDRPLPLLAALGSGFCMGGADAVPGVSGGTIALVLGIYERFIGAIAAVLRAPTRWKDPEVRRDAFGGLRLLVPLGAGLVVAYLLVSKLLVGKPDAPGFVLDPATAPLAYAFFFGLVLASIPEPLRRCRRLVPAHGLAVVCGAAAAFLFSGLGYATGQPPFWALFLGGAGAISVMLLPGVSGSLLLVILGQYQPVLQAVNTRDLAALAPTVLGVLFGVVTFVPLLRRALRVAHDWTMAVLTGFLVGSLRAVWPWKDNYDMKHAEMNAVWPDELGVGVFLAAILGAVVIRALARVERLAASRS